MTDAYSQENAESEQEFGKLQEELVTAKSELSKVNNDLDSVTSDLNSANSQLSTARDELTSAKNEVASARGEAKGQVVKLRAQLGEAELEAMFIHEVGVNSNISNCNYRLAAGCDGRVFGAASAPH